MFRTPVRSGFIYCRIIDTMRMDEPYAKANIIFPTKIDIGDGIQELSSRELQDLIDKHFARSQRFATVKGGHVYDRFKRAVGTVRANEKYIITGNMRGGYIKGDMRFGPRLTGYSGATTKPGLRWNGDDL